MAKFSGRLSQAPVVYALCEIRFAQVLKMAAKVPDIQEHLREKYDGFEEERIAGFVVAGTGQSSVDTELRWRFEDADQERGYILRNGALVFHTTAYEDFEQFVPEVLRGIETVSEIAKISRFQRMGLRFIDLIEGTADISADQLIHRQLRGFGSELTDVREGISQYVFNGTTKIGKLVFRATRGHHNVYLPPDLLPVSLNLKRSPDPTNPSIFLDTDHIFESKSTPVSEIKKLLGELKATISATFKNAITDEAVKLWK